MRYIHFVLVGLCIVLSAFVSPAYGTEANAMIHYSETFVEIQDELALEQGYSIKVMDINSENGDSWIELYLNGNRIDTDAYFAKQSAPFEYIKTVTDEDDEEIEYLIIRIKPIEVIEEPLSTELKVEQFLDPEFDAAEYLILDKTRSIRIGTPLELEEEHTLEASGLEDTSVTLTLSKNGYPIKEEEVEKGDMFTYSKTVDGKVITIFIAKFDDFFVGTDSEVIFLEQVSQRANIVIESDATITIEGADSAKIRAGDIAIISYTIENEDISEVKVLLDGKQIDHRSGISTGTTYSTVNKTSNAGIHEVVLTTVASDGTMSTHTKTFTVEASIASEAAGLAAEVASEAASDMVGKIGEDNETVGKVLELPGFGSMLSAIIIGLVFMSMRARKK